MPLNESKRKTRERWPLDFDLEGVPRNNSERKRLVDLKKQKELLKSLNEDPTMTVTNSFAVDYQAGEHVVDINNPPKQRYNPRDPKNQFPRLVYHHDTGAILEISDEKRLKVAQKQGYKLEPSPKHDYSDLKGSHAQLKSAAEPRPEQLLEEQLEEEEDESA